MDIEKQIYHLNERLNYLKDIFAGKHAKVIELLQSRLETFTNRTNGETQQDPNSEIGTLEELFTFMEHKLETKLTPMDKVRIVRHPQRICLHDILENVYDNFTEIAGQQEHSIDPSMLIARATITRRRGKKNYNQFIMVIGQEKGHGEEFRNGGSVKPWGNSKALHYMKVAETEGIPIHTYVFTPGSYPIEDTPGAAQQIAKNLYEMADLSVPIISIISEGGSGGAEAIALADKRLMLSHGYYSVISPEGAAAIEGKLKPGERATPELIEFCANQLHMTAQDNLLFGFIDGVIQEPDLGARPHHYDFFRKLRQEVIRATDEVVLGVRGLGLFRRTALNRLEKEDINIDGMYVGWKLNLKSCARLVSKRQKKFITLSKNSCLDRRPFFNKFHNLLNDSIGTFISKTRYFFYTKCQRKIRFIFDEITSELHLIKSRLTAPLCRIRPPKRQIEEAVVHQLTTLSDWDDTEARKGKWSYISPRATEDRSISCPNSATHGCFDLWAPDLFGEFAGVCTSCGHHFPMEYQWVAKNIFDENSIREFNTEIEAINPLKFTKFDEKLIEARKKTKLKSGCITFEATIHGIKTIVAIFVGSFRGGSVGAAEGTKFVEAIIRATKKRYPFLAYVHGTAGIRIQEGTHGLAQMPRCTVAVRRYINAGGLYIVLYDTNSYAGPVASFLGCSPYQYAIRSSNIGFAGRSVIKETTGMDIPPDYHNAYKALARGHIQGVWDRREAQANLKQLLLTVGGRNLYYR